MMSRLFALLFMLLLSPAPMMAEITVMSDLDGGSNNNQAVSITQHAHHSSKAANLGPDGHQSHVINSGVQSEHASVYRLNSGDAISITVFGQDALNLDAILDDSGVINYPFIGKIFVAGLSVSSLTQVITDGLRNGYLRDPHVNVSIVKYRPFYITGQVVNPGSYPYEPGLNINKAISLAGGFTELASSNDITIVLEGSSKLSAKKISLDAAVHPGDTLSIGEMGYFFIDGEVNTPGRYPYKAGLTLRKAIALAGGFTEQAAKNDITIVPNKGTDEKQGHMNDIIQPGDSITVDESLF
ncbi:MAG: polysaccharide biosynthesis/export family protein [Mariprofundaceae bacterium]